MITNPLPLANQLTDLLQALCRIVAVEGRRLHMPRPLIALAWNRVARLANRFLALVHRLNEGKLSPVGTGRRPASRHPPTGPSWRTRHVAWLLRMMRSEVVACAGALEYYLSWPEMAELIREAPHAGRILRPLCRILDVKIPPELRLPRHPSPQPSSASQPKPARGEGEAVARPAGGRTLVRLGAGDLWRAPDALWPTREEAQKFDAKIWVLAGQAVVRR
jgi:hypothetical protein